MTNEEFLNEALKSAECPENFEQIYNSFCNYQSLVLDALREFARVCDRNNIHYQLAFGSMIGAVRDNGQIPWDYDVDVLIPFKEKDLLIKSLEMDLDDKYQFFSPETVNNYYVNFVRVLPAGYPHDMLHVDVFYLIGIPDNEPERSAYIREARNRYNARKYALQDLKNKPYSVAGKTKRWAKKAYYLLRYGKNDIESLNSLFGRYEMQETKEAITVSVGIGRYIYPSHIFLNSIKIKTREGTFNIPADFEAFLSYRYGNWMKYFPVEDRIAEVLKHYNQFKWYKEHGLVPADAPELP